MPTPAIARHRSLLLGLTALAVLVIVLALVGAEPARGQAPDPDRAFHCDGSLFLTTGSPDDMALHRIDQNSGDLVPIGSGGLVANALAYNPADDFLYGMSEGAPHDIVRVDATGRETNLGPAQGAPSQWLNTVVGTFLENGHYLVLGNPATRDVPPGSVPAIWAEIDVATTPPTVVRTFSHPSVGNSEIWDVAIDPTADDPNLAAYAMSRTEHRIVRIDLATGVATPVGPTFSTPAIAGSTFFDSFGRLWLYGSGSRVTQQDTLYRIDDPVNGRPVAVGSGPVVHYSDGASCPFSVAMDKTARPDSVCAGDTVRFRFEITNETAAAITADFVDDLPPGLSAVAGTLVNPLGGHVEEDGADGRLHISGITIPADTTQVLAIDTLVDAAHGPGTVTNQAGLLGLSGTVGPIILSEDPSTPAFPDPTGIEVRSCSDLAVAKRTDLSAMGPGDRADYEVSVTNHGPSPATGVDSLIDALPAGTTFVAASDGGALTGFGTVQWPPFDLDVGASRSFTVTVEGAADIAQHANDAGAVVNRVSIDHPGDDHPDNDRDQAAVPVALPDLAVHKDDGRARVSPGDETTYRLSVTNHGEAIADGAVLSDRLPEGTTFVAASSGATMEGRVVTWPAVDLAPSESMDATITVQVDEAMGAGDEVANVASVAHPADPRLEDNTDDDVDQIEMPRPAPERSPSSGGYDWLPRTGAGLVAPATIGAGLLLLGLTAWLGSRQRLP